MTTVKEMRTSVDQTLDRWEMAALALEENINATLTAVSERVQTQKEKAAEASENLEKAIERAQQLPSDARKKIVGELGELKVQLALGKAEAHDAVLAQNESIGEAVQRVENQIDQVGQQIDKKIREALEAWVRAEVELQQGLELAALRFDNEKAEKRAQFEANKQDILDKVKKFREAIEERRTAAAQKGSTFASDMTSSFEQMRTAFRNLAK